LNSEPQIIYTPPSWFERLDWQKVFPRTAPIEVDLGCGDGSFLIESAQLRPQHNFLGVERLLGRIRKVEKKARRLNLANVRALRIENSYAVGWLFPPESVAIIHVLFPDPWPKKRHHRRRLFQPEFVAHAHRALQRGGVLNVATDHKEYFEQMLSVCAAHGGFTPRNKLDASLIGVATDFEKEFAAEGRKTFRAQFVKV
jgi:tRNA (guanine-N7-)-methyltransferase